MSRDDTARITSGWDGKRCSIFLDWPNPGSLVEKKKFSSTTGLRLTNTATITNNATVTASICQCVLKLIHLGKAGRFIVLASGDYAKRKEPRRHRFCSESAREHNAFLDQGPAGSCKRPCPQAAGLRYGKL